MKTNDVDISRKAERGLAAGVLKQAAEDLRRFHAATGTTERELYRDAYRWLMSDDSSWPFSFLNVCRTLGRVPDDVRRDLLGNESLGAVSYWTQRGARRLVQLRKSLGRLFNGGRNPGPEASPDLIVHNPASAG